MATEHDRIQDERIAANAEAIRKQTEYLREIRNHFLPEAEEARFKRLARTVVSPILKGLAVVAFVGGLWDVVAWLENRYNVRTMARRYAEVAEGIYYGENNPEVAGAFLDKAIELRGDYADYRYLRAYMKGMAATRRLLNLDRPLSKAELDQAHEAYAEALFLQGLRPKRAEPWVLMAQISAALKETDRAEAELDKALEADPGSSFVRIRLAQVRMDRKDAAGAESALADALRLDPESKWVWLWKGVFERETRKDAAAARTCYERALEIDPKFDMAWYNLAWTWMGRSETSYPKAREALQRALALNPDYKEACYAMGMTYGYEDNYPVAKVWMDKAVALDGSFLTAVKWRGIVNGEMGRFADAVADFDRAILLDPMNADLYVRRAKMEEKLGKADEALRDLRFALDLAPEAKRTWMYLGDVYKSSGDAASALDCYGRAIALDPGYDDAHARRAAVLDGQGDREGALAAIDAAIAAAKQNPKRFWLQKADLLASWERLGEAVACCGTVLELDPGNTAALRKTAEWDKALGDLDGCRKALAAYLELVPTDAEMRALHQALSTDAPEERPVPRQDGL